MSNPIKTVKLICADVESNHNKYWEGTLYDDDTVAVKWGRVGYDLQSKTFDAAGERFLNKKEKEKLNKGYTLAKIVGESGTSQSVPKSNLHAIAKAQLSKNSPVLDKLIDRLVQANIHNIVSQTNITYNSSTGLFQTPLGIITQDGIVEARNLLVEIKKCIIGKCKLDKLVSDYLRIIPQNIGMKFRVENIFPDLDSVKKQLDILDSLEASYKAVTSSVAGDKTSQPGDLEKVFEVELDILQNQVEQDRLTKWYHDSMKSMHGYGHVKIQQIYSVKIVEMDKAFCSKVGNVTEVFHGTSQANVLSILKSGLKCSPPSTAYIAGKAFGNGTYGAVNSSKSLGYTFGGWGGSSSGDSGWLFVCDFAMGKYYEPTSTCSRPPTGYESIWAKAKKAGLYHDELIVYRDNAVNIKYLIECK